MSAGEMVPFSYDDAILSRFSNLAGGAMLGSGLRNTATPPELFTLYMEEQRRVLAEIGSTPLSALEPLSGWRSAFRQFGVDPTQYRSAVEALLRRLTKKGDIPSINVVVDACNLVSIRYKLPVAGFDLARVHGTIKVQFASGQDVFTPLGEGNGEHPEPGEVIFADAHGLVVARRWCWRQSDESAARENTHEALFTIEAQHPGGRQVIEQALDDLRSLLETYAGGQYRAATVAG